jgi:hypothetical protein
MLKHLQRFQDMVTLTLDAPEVQGIILARNFSFSVNCEMFISDFWCIENHQNIIEGYKVFIDKNFRLIKLW